MATLRIPLYDCGPLEVQIAAQGLRIEPLVCGCGARAVATLSDIPRRGNYHREGVDRVLFALRLWKPGMFSCPTAIADDGSVGGARWYRPWKTWDSSPIERPFDWSGCTQELPQIWDLLGGVRDLSDPRIRRFAYFYFYPVGVDRFAMLFMSADGLLIPLRGKRNDRREVFVRRGACLLASLLREAEADLTRELGRYYDKRCGHFHGTSTYWGRDMQKPAERLEQFVRALLRHFLKNDWVKDPKKAESALEQLTTASGGHALRLRSG